MIGLKFIFSLITVSVAVAASDNSQVAKKWTKMSELSSKNGPLVKMNNYRFKELVFNTNRNYTVIALFTASDASRGCQICPMAVKEAKVLADSHKVSPDHKTAIFFALVDFDDAMEIFQMMNLNSAPIFYIFPSPDIINAAKSRRMKKGSGGVLYELLDIQHAGFEAEVLARMIRDNTEVNIAVKRPYNYFTIVTMTIVTVMFAVLLYVRRDSLSFLTNPSIWAVTGIAFILLMLSGQMWNQIRGAPLLQTKGGRAVAYFHRSTQGQFIAESYLVIGMYAAITVGFLLMLEAVPANSWSKAFSKSKVVNKSLMRSLFGSTASDVMSVTGVGLFFFFFSLMLSIFRTKSGGYPYSLMF